MLKTTTLTSALCSVYPKRATISLVVAMEISPVCQVTLTHPPTAVFQYVKAIVHQEGNVLLSTSAGVIEDGVEISAMSFAVIVVCFVVVIFVVDDVSICLKALCWHKAQDACSHTVWVNMCRLLISAQDSLFVY